MNEVKSAPGPRIEFWNQQVKFTVTWFPLNMPLISDTWLAIVGGHVQAAPQTSKHVGRAATQLQPCG